jgi:hypothetical protein
MNDACGITYSSRCHERAVGWTPSRDRLAKDDDSGVTIDLDLIAVLEEADRADDSNDCRHAELTRESGCVLQQGAFLHDDARGSCKQWREMRVQNPCHENRVSRHTQSQ